VTNFALIDSNNIIFGC